MELISRQVAMNKFCDDDCDDCDFMREGRCSLMVSSRKTRNIIAKIDAVDAVLVVRCKDCYHSTDHPFIDNTIDCDKLDITVDEDFYCKFGITANDFARMDGDKERD